MFVKKNSRRLFLALITTALILTACNVGAAPSPTLDVGAINTAIVGTTIAQVSAQFTQTALAIPPTPIPTNTAQELPTFALPTTDSSGALPTVSFEATTPLAGFTPLPSPAPTTSALGDTCNNSAFEGDITIPDGTVMKPGDGFQKIWKIRNTGTCTWDEGYALVFLGTFEMRDAIDAYDFKFEKSNSFVAGGEAVNIPLNLVAPCSPGPYEGHWRMRNDAGYYFGTILSLYIEVKNKC